MGVRPNRRKNGSRNNFHKRGPEKTRNNRNNNERNNRNNNDRRERGDRNERNDRGDRNERNERIERFEERNVDSGLTCVLCNKSIREASTAIIEGTEKAPAHFDCVVKNIAEKEEMENTDRVCYLGNGSFGIIAFRNSSSPIRFLIKKRIQYETKEEIPAWRKNLAVKLAEVSSRSK